VCYSVQQNGTIVKVKHLFNRQIFLVPAVSEGPANSFKLKGSKRMAKLTVYRRMKLTRDLAEKWRPLPGIEAAASLNRFPLNPSSFADVVICITQAIEGGGLGCITMKQGMSHKSLSRPKWKR
jgi:hypothetical protein